jgi:hypothetical protein
MNEEKCRDCGKKADIEDLEYGEYFCVSCAKKYNNTPDEIVHFSELGAGGTNLKEVQTNG